ncbi:hypothetical protein M0802_014509 [Mischocyttarus mexicanus]|nr:hypothetical protein M0802_014509 [Mischocyttarus mexicanus]
MRRRNNGFTAGGNNVAFCCQNARKSANRSFTGGSCNESEGNEPLEWCIYAAVTLVAIGCYLNSLGGDFVHDDIPAVVRNKDVIAQTPISNILKDDFWGTPMQDVNSHKSYRPLTTLTFSLPLHVQYCILAGIGRSITPQDTGTSLIRLNAPDALANFVV